MYVTWTRSGDTLLGQLTQAKSAEDGSGTVDTQRVDFDGTAEGSSVSLRLNQGLGNTSTLTGTIDGDTLTLDYPGLEGDVVTVRLREGDAEDFNAALGALRDEVAQAKQDADLAAADQQARDDAAGLADGVRASMDALAGAAENTTASNPDYYASSLDTIGSSLDTVKSSYEVLTDSVQNGYDTVCDDAEIVADDVEIMEEDIATMRSDVRANSDPGVLADDIRELRGQLAELEAVKPALVPADAPTRADVGAAIRAARRNVRRQGGEGVDFDAAQRLFDQANAIRAKADAACRAAGG